MKLKSTIYSLIITVLAISSLSFNYQQNTKKYLYVRVHEYYVGTSGASRILIINELDEVEEIKLLSYKGNGLIENGKTISKVLNDLATKGYELISSYGGPGEGKNHFGFIFIKN